MRAANIPAWPLTQDSAPPFDQVYHAHKDVVYSLCLYRVQDTELAADLAQQVFERVHRGLAGFEGRSSLRTWVCRIALNCVRDHYRRQRSWRSWLQAQPQQQATAASTAFAHEDRQLVQTAVARLSPKLQEVVLLRYVQEMEYAEIAQTLGIDEGTVGSRLHRAHQQLRVLLKPCLNQ